MRKSQFYAVALGFLALASCTDDNLVTTGDELAQLEAAEGNAITFGTYMSGTPTTRAGYRGAITTDVLKDNNKAKGFGVFAWYTGTKGYGDYNKWSGGSVADIAPNFMYNQRVYWNNSAGYVTGWGYAPLKFWPNEVQNGDVDDQDNDSGSDPASTNYSHGGNLSFFAYAPYVSVTPSTGVPTSGSTTEGITALSANDVTTDPTVTYVVPADGSEIVDLLWGTYSGTSSNVLGQNNAGVASEASDATVVTSPKTSVAYPADILQGYTTNADLNKQKTNGTVNFAFKHALAKVGGYKAESGNTNAGLMVILDIDDQKGAETGFSKPDATKVTINSINIKARAKVDTSTPTDGTPDAYLKKAQGTLDLATGKWTILTESNTDASQAQAAVTDYDITVATGQEGQLNENIAESTTDTWNAQPAGVLTTKAQNVYKADTEAYPLVFIPGTYPELTITVEYTVRTQDTKLSGGTTKILQKIQKRITFAKPVELNKQYSLLMHLGLTSVKFTAEVSDWDTVGTVETTTPTGLIDGGEIYLPINVGEAAATVKSENDASTTITVPAGTTAVNVTFTDVPTSTAFTTDKDSEAPAADAVTANGTTTGTTQVIRYTMNPNTTTSDISTHKFTFTCDSKTNTITIKQEAGALDVKAANVLAAAGGTTLDPSYTVKTAVGGTDVTGATFAKDDGDTWVTNIDSDGKLTVNANSGTTNRYTVVTVTKDNAVGTVRVMQGAALIVTQSTSGTTITLTVKAADDSTEVTLTSANLVVTDSSDSVLTLNTDYEVTDGTSVTIKKTGTDTYKVSVTINDATGEVTTGSITVTAP